MTVTCIVLNAIWQLLQVRLLRNYFRKYPMWNLPEGYHPVVYNQATCDTKLKCWCSHYHMVNRKLTVSMQILGKQIRTLAMLVLRAHFKLVLFLTTLHSLVFMLYSARLM